MPSGVVRLLTSFPRKQESRIPGPGGCPGRPFRGGRRNFPGGRMTGVLPRYAPLLLLALAWEAVSRLGIVPIAALPPLDQVAGAWLNLAESGDLWTNGVASISRAAAGLGLAIACGSVIGMLMALYLPVRVVINPIVQFFYPMPKSALIPVMVLWLGFGDASKIVLIFVGCMLPVTLSAFNGARGTDQVLIWSARSLGASRARVLWEVVVPSALPELLSGIRTALAFAFVLLVASELIVARSGFGYMIGWLGDGGVYDAMFAVVLTVALLGFAADRGFFDADAAGSRMARIEGAESLSPHPSLPRLRPLAREGRGGGRSSTPRRRLVAAGRARPRLGSAVAQRRCQHISAAAIVCRAGASLGRCAVGRVGDQSRNDALSRPGGVRDRRDRWRRDRHSDDAQQACAVVFRSDRLGRLPDAEDRLSADFYALARPLRYFENFDGGVQRNFSGYRCDNSGSRRGRPAPAVVGAQSRRERAAAVARDH